MRFGLFSLGRLVILTTLAMRYSLLETDIPVQ